MDQVVGAQAKAYSYSRFRCRNIAHWLAYRSRFSFDSKLPIEQINVIFARDSFILKQQNSTIRIPGKRSFGGIVIFDKCHA
jgi:hypothetical protein